MRENFFSDLAKPIFPTDSFSKVIQAHQTYLTFKTVMTYWTPCKP